MLPLAAPLGAADDDLMSPEVVEYTWEMVVRILGSDVNAGCGIYPWEPQRQVVAIATGNAAGVIETIDDDTALFEGCIFDS